MSKVMFSTRWLPLISTKCFRNNASVLHSLSENTYRKVMVLLYYHSRRHDRKGELQVNPSGFRSQNLKPNTYCLNPGFFRKKRYWDFMAGCPWADDMHSIIDLGYCLGEWWEETVRSSRWNEHVVREIRKVRVIHKEGLRVGLYIGCG